MAAGFKSVGALIACSLLISSTGAAAATSPIPVSASVPSSQISPWVALSAMGGGASAAALCGAAAVTAGMQTPGGCVLPALDVAPPVVQTVPQPVPVPPVETAGGLGLGVDPLLLALGVLAAGALIYFLVRNNDDNDSNSPA